MCPRIKSSNHSAKVAFIQQAWSERLAFVGLILKRVRISSMTCSSCVNIVVSKILCELDFPSSRWAMWVMAATKSAEAISYCHWVT